MPDGPTRLLINGELRDAAAGATFTIYDPARGVELATVAKAGSDDVDAAVTAARTAFEGAWAESSPAKRARALNKLAQLVDEQTDALAELESRNNGREGGAAGHLGESDQPVRHLSAQSYVRISAKDAPDRCRPSHLAPG